ncbi:MAG: polymer-forming cytoskeletal protein, partial [Rhodobiaceae bacterium]|nr:polymer-forming cytoskeletal protein [Rhodobiaceae bacterium]
MFSRSKDNTKPVASSAPVPAKRSAGRTAPSIISADLIVEGNLIASGDIQIDGTVQGNVRSVSLTIGEKATINGEVVAEDMIVRGR